MAGNLSLLPFFAINVGMSHGAGTPDIRSIKGKYKSIANRCRRGSLTPHICMTWCFDVGPSPSFWKEQIRVKHHIAVYIQYLWFYDDCWLLVMQSLK